MTKVQQFRAARLQAEYRDLLKSIESVQGLLMTENFTTSDEWVEDSGSDEFNGLQTILSTMNARKLSLIAEFKTLKAA
jgi:hypothetical protein